MNPGGFVRFVGFVAVVGFGGLGFGVSAFTGGFDAGGFGGVGFDTIGFDTGGFAPRAAETVEPSPSAEHANAIATTQQRIHPPSGRMQRKARTDEGYVGKSIERNELRRAAI
jgi:hypothetical protein